MGFSLVARHRSREVLLYRQGPMNLIVNAQPDALPGLSSPGSTAGLAAIGLRVRDAAYAHRHALELGAWDMPTRASAMELNIPGIHGVGDSLLYFVDRHGDFSIYDVDFVPLAGAHPRPRAIAGLHFFGGVQAVLVGRPARWVGFFRNLFGLSGVPQGKEFRGLPRSPPPRRPLPK